MNKWIIGLIMIVVLIAFIVWERGGTKTAYVNGLPEYRDLPGREYIFERDCYIFKFTHQTSTYPLVGANAPTNVCTVPQLPVEVSDSEIGKDHPEVRILDIVRTGSRFKLVSVRRDETRGKTAITFEILFVDEGSRHYPRLDAYYLLDHTPESQDGPPKFVEAFAVERVKK